MPLDRLHRQSVMKVGIEPCSGCWTPKSF